MGRKVFGLFVKFFCLFLALIATSTNSENVAIIDSSASNATSKQVISGKPIVIHTQLQHYDQPTLKEYQECHENLEKCKTVCEGVENPMDCSKECPVCPFLIKEEIVMQGINDTDYRPASATPLNTTNIIRLTNQIQNIIENQHGNIAYRNENVVHIHQNVSRTGGKFGLGHNNTDPCCIILRSSKNCEARKFSTAARCHRKRHRVCGEQCKARVMLAKRVTVCEQPESVDDYENETEEICHQTVKYVAYNRRKRTTRKASKCTYIPLWPFVSCQNNQPNRDSGCGNCQRLPYAYILRNGMPLQCRRCFMSYSNPGYGDYPSYGGYDIFPPPWYPPVIPMTPTVIDDNFNFEEDYDFENGGWKQEKTKCKLPNGIVSDNCPEIEGSGSGAPSIIDKNHPSTKDPWQDLPEAQDEYDDFENYDDILDNASTVRRRRQTFPRSKYSRRYK